MAEKVEVVEHLEGESFALDPLDVVSVLGFGKAGGHHLHQSSDRMLALRGNYNLHLLTVS